MTAPFPGCEVRLEESGLAMYSRSVGQPVLLSILNDGFEYCPQYGYPSTVYRESGRWLYSSALGLLRWGLL